MSEKPKSKRKYLQSFKEAYNKEFPCMLKSRKGDNFVFCKFCCVDINIGHGGKGDIINHIGRKKHKENASASEKCTSIQSFFQDVDSSVIRAECFFTAFIIEHNLPVSIADHVGPLLRKMFPNSDVAKHYGCARTKTTAIVGEFAKKGRETMVSALKAQPFCLATDGNNDSDKKIYPVVVNFYNAETNRIEVNLLSAPVLEGEATGRNIANLLLKNLEKFDIPITNCIGFAADNAPVMLGRKNGVIAALKEHQNNMIIVGCPCHLLHLAAQKSASVLPIGIDELLVDIYYYLVKSSKRKEKLKTFQELHSDETKKILKHVCTRWLSVCRCLERLISQWDALVSFFKEEISIKKTSGSLEFYKIPIKQNDAKKSGCATKPPMKIPIKQNDAKKSGCATKPPMKRKVSQAGFLDCAMEVPKVTNKEKRLAVLSREERLFYILTTDINKAYCLFLLNSLSSFEAINMKLQAESPLIHRLRPILLEFFTNILIKFVKPSVIRESRNDILDVRYHVRDNQKDDADIVIGYSTTNFLTELEDTIKVSFFNNIRLFYVTACNYILNKFPLKDEVLCHAQVCSLQSLESASFSDVKFFLERFPVLVKGSSKENMVDDLEIEFNKLQSMAIPRNILEEERIDRQWYLVGEIEDEAGQKQFSNISRFMLSILCLPHSNAHCERIFSQMRKLKTDLRSSFSDENLENFLISKCNSSAKCYEHKFDSAFLKNAKSAAFVKKN